MPFCNVTYQLLIFEDQSDRNPQIRLPDITKNIQGVTVANDRSEATFQTVTYFTRGGI